MNDIFRATSSILSTYDKICKVCNKLTETEKRVNLHNQKENDDNRGCDSYRNS